MGYLNENGLARYDGLLKNWVTLKSGTIDGIDPLLNWQKTDTAGAVTCYPLPVAPIDPVVSFAFTETGPASGDKAPDNPSTITGVSQVKVTRCGKNICPPKPYTPITYRGVSFEYDPSDGGIFIQGTADADKNPLIDFIVVAYGNNPAPFVRGKTYSFYLACSDSNVSMQLYDKTADTISGNSEESGTQFVHTIKSDSRSILFRLSVARGAAVNTKAYVQIEEGSAATAFEPYEGADYTVNLGGTYYGGSVDLSAGTMTVTWWGIALNGQNGDFQLHSSSTDEYKFFQWNGVESGLLVGLSNPTFSHFVYDYNLSSVNTYTTYSTGGTIRLKVSASDFPDLASLNAWFATQYSNGTPAVFCAQLAANKRYTVSLTPTQIYSLSQIDSYNPRANTVYSDQVSVQVGYPKSPQATQNELTNAIVSLGGNI